MTKRNNPILELAIAAQYIPTNCPVCGKTIATLEEFKTSRAGVTPDWVHAACWETYEQRMAPAAHVGSPLRNRPT